MYSSKMTSHLDTLIGILPFVFVLHNIEEAFSMEKWTHTIPYPIHMPVTTRQFTIAVGLFSLLGFASIFTRNHYPSEMLFLSVVTGFAGMLLLNVFFPHVIATLLLRRYTPGVITGLLINLPLTASIIWTIHESHKLSDSQILISVILGGLIGITLTFLFLKIGELIDANLST